MKVCKYCNSECDDTEKVCHSCGASEFSNKCRNCGTVFDLVPLSAVAYGVSMAWL